MGQWDQFKKQCLSDYDEWRASVDPLIEEYNEHDLEQWSLEVYKSVMGQLGDKKKVQGYFSKPEIRSTLLGNIKRVRKTWRKKYKYTGEISQDELCEWTYAIIYSLHHQDKRLLMAEINTTLKDAKAPRFLKRQVLKILERSPLIK